jgi:hypothetical protein
MQTSGKPILVEPGNSRRWKYVTPLQRFEEKYIPEPNSGCWLWTGVLNEQGYGKMLINYRGVLAHRFSYQTFTGPLLGHLVLDHLCRVRCCVNPDHLEQVPQLENMRRAVKPHCRRGHVFTEENTWADEKTGIRQCRTCNRLRYLKRKAQEAASCSSTY